NAEPTPPILLNHAKEIISEYLKYIYLGNISANNNTYCPFCKELLIKRTGYKTQLFFHQNPIRCPKCQNKLTFILD
ncbi:MAG: hypothetical protein JXA60_03220, partial [Candidatus Coatesbacteria bacterium]|nr:hypothetical protein [Candidatus Coatesbacteria bacterium]